MKCLLDCNFYKETLKSFILQRYFFVRRDFTKFLTSKQCIASIGFIRHQTCSREIKLEKKILQNLLMYSVVLQCVFLKGIFFSNSEKYSSRRASNTKVLECSIDNYAVAPKYQETWLHKIKLYNLTPLNPLSVCPSVCMSVRPSAKSPLGPKGPSALCKSQKEAPHRGAELSSD